MAWSFPSNPGGLSSWSSFGCGDGEDTLIDPANNDIYYGCSQYGSCIRRYNGPVPVTNATISNGTVSQRRNWLTSIVFDPDDPSILYYGGNVLNKSTDRGSSWTRISPPEVDLTRTFESPDRCSSSRSAEPAAPEARNATPAGPAARRAPLRSAPRPAARRRAIDDRGRCARACSCGRRVHADGGRLLDLRRRATRWITGPDSVTSVRFVIPAVAIGRAAEYRRGRFHAAREAHVRGD